jgi:alpha-L-rhamnosidase
MSGVHAEGWAAQWIWRSMAPGEDDVNIWMLARREFELDGSAKTALLRVSADTRYQLFINGQLVTDGPVKAYPEQYRYDRVEVARFLRPGTNVIAVRVHHWGRDTAQNIAVRPGLLVQLSWEDNRGLHTLGTDNTWRVIEDAAHDTRSPQISAHLGFEEQYDARRERLGWMKPGYDASEWEAADAFSTVAQGPWRNLRHSGIPPLAKTFHPAIAVISTRSVRPPQVAVTINVGRCQGIARKENNRNRHRFVLAGIVSSDRDQDAVLLRPSAGFIFGRIRMSGAEIDVREDLLTPERLPIRLLKGDNPVVIVLNDMSEVEEFQFALDAEGEIELRAAFGKGPWSLAGPFTGTDSDWSAISSAASLAELEPFRSRFRDLAANEVIGADVHALTCHRREFGPARVFRPEAMVTDNELDAIIPAGEDNIELMIDHGKEYNAHVQFEIQAPAGVIVDANIFERFHERAPQWPWRNRSSFRYVTREGWQTYATMRRYGGRYLALTVRARPAEVRIRRVGVVASHYPVADRGAFFSSDPLLNTIWRVCRQTMLSCMEDTFVDCPLYEQSLWLGDARNAALVSYAMFGDGALAYRGCELGGESLARGDLAAMRVPTRWGRIIPAWSFLWLRMCWENYLFTGDRDRLVEVSFPRIRQMLDTCLASYIDEATGLFSISAWQFFDWIDGLDTNHRIVLHNNTFLVDSLRLGAQMADIAGKADLAQRYQWAADRLVESINEHLWDEQLGAYVDSIHDNGSRSTSIARPFNTLALLHGVVPPERQASVLQIALGERTEKITPFGSPFATFYLLELLGETDRVETMLDLIREQWGGMLDDQTTTFWESFATGNLGGGRYPTRSYSHAWSAGPAYVFSRYVMGAKIEEPGGSSITLTPRVDVLDHLVGVVPLLHGSVRLEWTHAADGKVDLRIEATGVAVTFVPIPGWRIDSTDAKRVELQAGTAHALRLVPLE